MIDELDVNSLFVYLASFNERYKQNSIVSFMSMIGFGLKSKAKFPRNLAMLPLFGY